MKVRFTKLLTVVLFLLVCLNLAAQEVPPITIHVEKAGTLSSFIADSKKYQITTLTLSGTLNGNDILFLREMMGADYAGNKTFGILSHLDISNTLIVAGGECYYKDLYGKSPQKEYYTSNQGEEWSGEKTRGILNGSSMTWIKYYAIYGEGIAPYMFYKCSSIISIVLPKNIKKIGLYAFYQCEKLENINIPEGVASIGDYAFAHSKLPSLNIPNTTKIIGDYILFGNKRITSIELSKNIEKLSAVTFSRCGILETISIDSENATYKSKDGVLFSKDMSTLIFYPNGKKDVLYEIPINVKSISEIALECNSHIETLIIPENVSYIGSQGLYLCEKLKYIYVYNHIPPTAISFEYRQYYSVIEDVSLYIPKGSYNAYWVAKVWGDFKNIIEMEYTHTSNESIESEGFKIYTGASYISIIVDRETPISIYKLSGELVKQIRISGSTQITLPTGSYIVKSTEYSQKVIVR